LNRSSYPSSSYTSETPAFTRVSTIEGIPFTSQILEANAAIGLSETDAKQWSERACGIACVDMVLRFTGKIESPSIWPLINEGLELGAYCDRGWIHAGLAKLLGRYGLEAKCHRNQTIAQLGALVESGSICITSVSVGFCGGQINNGRTIAKGGHLTLVHGVARDGSNSITDFRSHHPSSYAPWNWANVWVPSSAMSDSFSGNLIEIPALGERKTQRIWNTC
jgi:hypothetical protein